MRFQTYIAVILFSSASLAQSDWQQLTSGVSVNLNSIFFTGAGTGYAAGESGTVLKTTNAGLSWTSSTTTPAVSLNAVYFLNANDGLIAGAGGAIFRTTNGGTSWNLVPTGVTDNLFSLSFSGSTGICGGSSQTILRSTDGGASWLTVQTGYFGGGFFGAHMVNVSTGYVAGQNSIFQPMTGKTTNGGVNWTFTPFYINSNEGRLLDTYFFDSNNGLTAAAVWDGTGAVSKTTNGGSNWTSTIFGQAYSGMHFFGSTGFVVGTNGGIYRSTDGGGTWTPQNSGTTASLNDVFLPNGTTAYAVGDNGLILKNASSVPVELIRFTHSFDGRKIRLVWETASEKNNYGFEIERTFAGDEPRKWTKIGFVNGNGTTAEKQVYSFDDIPENSGYAGKLCYRLKQIDYDGLFNYSDEITVDADFIPGNYSLGQNYPNPFNPVTQIRYAVPLRGSVRLIVYNMIGEEVAELFNGIQDPGYHSIAWNAGNLPSGIYFYSLEAKNNEGNMDFRETKKMMLVK